MVDGKTSWIEALRIHPLEVRVPLLECELWTRDKLLTRLTLALHACGPFFRTGHDHFEAPELPASIRRQLRSGLFLRQIGFSAELPPPQKVDLASWARQYLPLGASGPRHAQVYYLEEYLHHQLSEARGDRPLTGAEHYKEKIGIKRTLLEKPDSLMDTLQGLRPHNAADLWLLQRSLEGYLAAQQAGDAY